MSEGFDTENEREVIKPLVHVSNEFYELTARTSLSIVLKINERLRNEKEVLQKQIDEFLSNPTVRGMTKKIQAQKNELEYLYGKLHEAKFEIASLMPEEVKFKGTGKLIDIIQENELSKFKGVGKLIDIIEKTKIK